MRQSHSEQERSIKNVQGVRVRYLNISLVINNLLIKGVLHDPKGRSFGAFKKVLQAIYGFEENI